MGDFVRRFEETSLQERPSVGGKGANLGELTRAGLPVPPGFVVATTCFRTFVAALPEAGDLSALERIDQDDLAALTHASEDMRARIEGAPIPGAVEDAIRTAHAALCESENHPVAVRSSATGEDGDATSFAGLQDTYLWVRGRDAVVEHVRKCWSSLYNVEALAYRRKLGLAEHGVAMAVVVQKMVDARCSGVMFTRSPTSGDRSVIVIEASYGLGSCIVSGEVTPDKFVVNKVSGEITDRAISAKTVQHLPQPEGGVRVEAVADALQSVPALSDAEIGALAQIARKVERHYGSPQDIEWAIAHDAAGPFLLQSRPETYWSRRDATPVAKPGSNAFAHVFAVFGGNR
ncbi:MAG TPA: PEP/pyruvate-binding domain-containing protein [Rhizomicrobium sp.]